MASPQATDQTADQVNSIFEKILNILVDLGLKAAEGSVPWLAAPVVRQIFEWLGHQAAAALILRGKQIVTKIVITTQMGTKISDAQTAKTALSDALTAGDPDAIKKANDEFNAKYAALAHYGGSASNAH